MSRFLPAQWIERLVQAGEWAGHGPGVADAAVSASLACQVLGGVAATLLAGRLRWFVVLAGCAVLNVSALHVRERAAAGATGKIEH